MIHIKPCVFFHHDMFRAPEMCKMIWQAQLLAPDGYEITITSGCDGKHKENSKHYRGRALDFRVNDFPAVTSIKTWAARLQNRLGDEYFVLLEPGHMHVQFNG